MKLIKEVKIKVKKSKFIGLCYEIEDVLEVKEILTHLKEEHKKARHIPYAYILPNTAGKSDDKEPTNTAGLPIYNLMVKKNLSKHLVAVVRYFGGTKLGAGNLLRAYLETANQATKDI